MCELTHRPRLYVKAVIGSRRADSRALLPWRVAYVPPDPVHAPRPLPCPSARVLGCQLPLVHLPGPCARSSWYNVGFARAAAACCLIIAFVAVYRCEKYRHAMGLTKSERAQRARREREQREATVSRLAWTRASSVIPRPPLRATLASLLGRPLQIMLKGTRSRRRRTPTRRRAAAALQRFSPSASPCTRAVQLPV